MGVERYTGEGEVGGQVRREVLVPLLSQVIQAYSELEGFLGGDRELLESCTGKLIEVFKGDRSLARALVIYGTPLIVKDLFHPKAGGGTVQQPEQGEMILLGGMAGQLDDWGGTVEDLPATVKDEVIVRGNEGKGDGEGSAEALRRDLSVLIPGLANFSIRLSSKDLTVKENRPPRPHIVQKVWDEMRRQRPNGGVIWKDHPKACCMYPVPNVFSNAKRTNQ
jgi:hypothetical protein